MDEKREYWAFISYRHLDNKEAGREWASWIAREIETYEVPTDLVGTKGSRGDTIPERIYPVFRDEDELSADADLSSPIYEALRNSKTVIVVCSPRAVSSRYVGNEITYFKSLGRGDRVLAMMIEGEPHSPDERECFPEALKHSANNEGKIDFESQVEPVAADFRLPDGSQGWHSPTQYREYFSDERSAEKYGERCDLAKLKLIAGILGVPLGKLIERDKAYQLALAKRKARIFTAVAAVMAVLAIVAIVGGVFAAKERDRAQRSEKMEMRARGTAEDLIGEMLFDLGGKLEEFGRLDLLEDVSIAAENYFQDLPPDQADSETERNRSVMLDSRARVLRSSGDLDAALEYFRDGLNLAKQLETQQPDDLQAASDVAISLRNVADILVEQNEVEAATPLYIEAIERTGAIVDEVLGEGGGNTLLASLLGENGEEAESTAQEILGSPNGVLDLMSNSAVLTERLAKVAANTGDLETAVARLSAATEIYAAFLRADPESTYALDSLFSTRYLIGSCELQRGNLKESKSAFQQNIDASRSLLENDGPNAVWREHLAGNLEGASSVFLKEGDFAEADKLAEEALLHRRGLSANDPGNRKRLRNLYVALSKAGQAASNLGDPDAANHFEEACEIAERLIAIDPTNAVWRQDYAVSLERRATALRKEENFEAALNTTLAAVEQHRQLAENNPENLAYRRNLLLANNWAAIDSWAMKRPDDVIGHFKESARIAETLLEDLPAPTVTSRKDISSIYTYLGQVEEERGRFGRAADWYAKAIENATAASNEGVAWEELTPQVFLEVTRKIAQLRSAAHPETPPSTGHTEEKEKTE